MIDRIIIDGLAFALPLFAMAVGGIFSEKSGITMLALEGIQGFGAFCGAVVFAFLQPLIAGGTGVIVYPVIFAAMVGGTLFALLHAYMSIRFRINQVISGVVINILAMSLTIFMTGFINERLTGEASNKIWLGAAPRFSVPWISKIPVIGAIFKDVYIFAPFILFFAVLVSILLYRTRFGLRLRACGENPESVEAAGSSVKRIRYMALALCGMLTGLGDKFRLHFFGQFLSVHFYGLWISRHRRINLRQLGYPAYIVHLSVFWFRPIRRLPAYIRVGNVERPLRLVSNDSIRAHIALVAVFFATQPSPACTGFRLRV